MGECEQPRRQAPFPTPCAPLSEGQAAEPTVALLVVTLVSRNQQGNRQVMMRPQCTGLGTAWQ